MAKKKNTKNEAVVRIFDELTGERIYDPDLEAGRLYNENNKILCKYILEQEEKYEIVPNPDIPPKPNGSRIAMKKIIQEEKGDWHIYDFRGGIEREVTENIGIHIDPNAPHELEIPNVEQIQIYHTYTQEELDEMARQEEQREESIKQAQAKELFISGLMNNDGLNALITQDQSTTETYEALTQEANITFKNTLPFSNAYARRIKRTEITIEETPSELQEEITEIISKDLACDFYIEAINGKLSDGTSADLVNNIRKDVSRLQSVKIVLVADEGYRVPTQEEFKNNVKLSAQNDDAETIEDYLDLYVQYYTTSSKSAAVITISVTEAAAHIISTIQYIKE